MRILLKVLYWLAVLAISLALVIGLILWFESQDASEIEGSGVPDVTSAWATAWPGTTSIRRRRAATSERF
jgi:cytochrome b subunit of formate dehydrogenase